jgi:hypothetical protein
MLTRIAVSFIFFVAATLKVGPAVSQQAPSPSAPPAHDCVPGDQRKEQKELSETLTDSKGVICPPSNIDTQMKVIPPETGSKMPVIKPPSSDDLKSAPK